MYASQGLKTVEKRHHEAYNELVKKTLLIFILLLAFFSTGCAATKKYTIKDKKLPKIPCKIAIVDDGKGTGHLFKEIFDKTESFEEVMVVTKEEGVSVYDVIFRQEAYDAGMRLVYIYEMLPVASDGATMIVERINEGAGTVARVALGIVGAVATAPAGGIGGAISERGAARIWPYQSSQRVKIDFEIINVYTGETIYSGCVVTTGGAFYTGYGAKGTDLASKEQASDIAMHNAFVQSTIELIENVSLKKDMYSHDFEE